MSKDARLRNGKIAKGSRSYTGKMEISDPKTGESFEMTQGLGPADAIVELNDGNIFVASQRGNGFFRILDPNNKKLVRSFPQKNIEAGFLLLLTDGRVAVLNPVFSPMVTILDPYEKPIVTFNSLFYAHRLFREFGIFLELEMLKGAIQGKISLETLQEIKDTDHISKLLRFYQRDNELDFSNNCEIPKQLKSIDPLLQTQPLEHTNQESKIVEEKKTSKASNSSNVLNHYQSSIRIDPMVSAVKNKQEPTQNLNENRAITKINHANYYPGLKQHSIMAHGNANHMNNSNTQKTGNQKNPKSTKKTNSCHCNIF